MRSGSGEGDSEKGEHFRKVGSLKDCFLNALLRNPSNLAFSSITNTYTVSLVSEGALDDFDKAKPSPAPPPKPCGTSGAL